MGTRSFSIFWSFFTNKGLRLYYLCFSQASRFHTSHHKSAKIVYAISFRFFSHLAPQPSRAFCACAKVENIFLIKMPSSCESSNENYLKQKKVVKKKSRKPRMRTYNRSKHYYFNYTKAFGLSYFLSLNMHLYM